MSPVRTVTYVSGPDHGGETLSNGFGLLTDLSSCLVPRSKGKWERGLLVKRQLPFLVALTVLVCAFANACSARREQEATLKQELRMMRAAIDAYTLEKQRAPQSLQDLVNDHYLKEIPT